MAKLVFENDSRGERKSRYAHLSDVIVAIETSAQSAIFKNHPLYVKVWTFKLSFSSEIFFKEKFNKTDCFNLKILI